MDTRSCSQGTGIAFIPRAQVDMKRLIKGKGVAFERNSPRRATETKIFADIYSLAIGRHIR